MAEVKQINVAFTFTKNLGNYESIKVDAGVVMSVEPGEDTEEVCEKAWKNARQQIRRGLDHFREEGLR